MTGKKGQKGGAEATLPAGGGMPPTEGMPPPGGSKGPGGPEPGSPVQYGKLWTWAWRVVQTAFGPFLCALALDVVVLALGLYDTQLVSSLTGLLSGAAAKAAGGPAKEAGASFIDALVPQSIMAALILFIALRLVQIVVQMGSRLVTAYSDQLMTTRLQTRLHDRLLRMGPAYHRTHDVGTTQLIVHQFAQGAQMIFSDLIAFPLLRAISLALAVMFLMGSLDKLGGAPAWMNWILLGILFTLPLATWWLSGKMRRAYTIVRESQKDVSEELLNSLSQPGEVQILGAEEQRSASFSAALKKLLRDRLRAIFRKETVEQLQQAAPNLIQVLFLAYGILFAYKSGDPEATGAVLGIYLFVPRALQPIQDLVQFYVGIQSSWAQVEEVVTVLEQEPKVLDRADAKDAPEGRPPLTLDGVVFSYDEGERRILDDVRHAFAPGTVSALVARSGGGKSTIFSLLCRLYDPQGGRITFGDDDIRDLKLRSYRGRVAKVSQFPLYIYDSIRNNFRLADAEATDDEIRAVCERTGLWGVLERASGPGDHPLDYILPRSQDQGLSGGERRMLSITRALLTDPAVLLLDEPTTGIDAIGREMVIDLIRELGSRMSIIVVDHNVREFISEVADEVCVLEDGKIVQIGSPAELAGQPGLFSDLYHHRDEDDDAGPGAGEGLPPPGAMPPGTKLPPGGPSFPVGGMGFPDEPPPEMKKGPK